MVTSIESLFESTQPKLLATGFVFAEGPVWHPDGFLYFSDIRDSKRFRIDLEIRQVELLAEDTFGGNGMTFDSQGRLVFCQPGKRRVMAIDGSNEVVLADNFDGKKLNAPNDVVPHSSGDIYFTNPEGRISGSDAEIEYSGVYRVSLDGEITEVCAGMNLPNGLAFSPDESSLYVSNTRPDPKLYVFEMQEDGSASNGNVFDEMPLIDDSEKNGVPDGMKVDSLGRIFCTGPGGVWIWEPDGAPIGVLDLGEVTTNLAWGGEDLRSLFVTTHSSVYELRAVTPGAGVTWV